MVCPVLRHEGGVLSSCGVARPPPDLFFVPKIASSCPLVTMPRQEYMADYTPKFIPHVLFVGAICVAWC